MSRHRIVFAQGSKFSTKFSWFAATTQGEMSDIVVFGVRYLISDRGVGGMTVPMAGKGLASVMKAFQAARHQNGAESTFRSLGMH
jgi:hypothetical protein